MRIYLTLVLLLATSLSANIWAVEESAESTSSIPSVVIESLKGVIKDFDANNISDSPIPGLYEVAVGEDMFYITKDGIYMVMGSIFNLKTRENLTNDRRSQIRQARNPERQKAIDAVSEKDMVVFAPETEIKYTVNVFTDVDCGYCAKFHNEVPSLNEAGVKVRYLAFPRAGIGSGTYKEMVSVWCAEDQQQAMTDAKARRKVKPAKCNNPIASQYELGQKIGVNGTPALVLSNGELVPGYLPAKKLIALLEQIKTK